MSIPVKVKLYELAPSPNCMKARIGLNLKAVPFKKIAVDPNDRIAVVKASGQPLTPAMVADGQIVFDSHAILRWLDGNVRKRPRFFASEYTRMKKIEEWEAMARQGFDRSLRPMYAMAFGRMEKSDAAIAAANAALHEDTAKIEAALQQGPWLMGDELSAADIMLAAALFYATQPQHAIVRALPFWPVFQRFDLGPERERTRDWVARVMAWDCWLKKSSPAQPATSARSSSRIASKKSAKKPAPPRSKQKRGKKKR
jgi:glutathione S-transferase